MNRISILAGGAVLASLLLCGGAVTVANALSSAPVSQVLPIAGVSTSPTATPSSVASDGPTATPTPSASATAEPGDDKGVKVVTPSDPTKVTAKDSATNTAVGKGCANGTAVPRDGQWTGTPVPQDPDKSASYPNLSGSTWSGSHNGTGGAWRPSGGTGGYGVGSGTGGTGTGQH
jgi:hypothetical protein